MYGPIMVQGDTTGANKVPFNATISLGYFIKSLYQCILGLIPKRKQKTRVLPEVDKLLYFLYQSLMFKVAQKGCSKNRTLNG